MCIHTNGGKGFEHCHTPLFLPLFEEKSSINKGDFTNKFPKSAVLLLPLKI